jgi:hypothetical protein
MTIPRRRIRAELASALGVYVLQCCALVALLLVSRADAGPAMQTQDAGAVAELAGSVAIPEPTPLALLGFGLLSAHLALRSRRRLYRASQSSNR